MIILAEAVSQENVKGLYLARQLSMDSAKYRMFCSILEAAPIRCFLRLHEHLAHFLNDPQPLVLVTDWSDPCELIGLQLETEAGTQVYPDLCFLAFYTDWEHPEQSGIETIFAHELSHLWLHRMGFRFELSQANRFHTCTAITDPYLAFSEGLAEHLEIVSREMLGQPTEVDVFYDQGYDPGAWLCTRDSALRQYAVKNNRFLYHTAIPEEENWDSYANLHMAHNNSSAFLPERLKNGLQAISSEGLIASFFYQMYRNPLLQEHKALDSLYSRFGILPEDITPPVNLYLKMLYSLSGVNLTKPTLFTDFIGSYISNFPAEADAIADVFGRVTNFVTVDPGAGKLFGDFYRIGRLGDISQLQSTYQQVKALKAACKTAILSNPESLTAAVYPSIWITADKRITPVPWEPSCQIPLKFDINAATAIDFYALDCLTFAQCRQLEAYREQIGGFASLKAFQEYVDTITK